LTNTQRQNHLAGKEKIMQEQFNFNRGAVKPIQCLSDGWEMLKGQYVAFLGHFFGFRGIK
jgi:hypothetical protein